MFAPRAYNRRWISIEDPPTWSLSIAAESVKSGAFPDLPAFGTRATLGVLGNLAYDTVSYALERTVDAGITYATVRLSKTP